MSAARNEAGFADWASAAEHNVILKISPTFTLPSFSDSVAYVEGAWRGCSGTRLYPRLAFSTSTSSCTALALFMSMAFSASVSWIS